MFTCTRPYQQSFRFQTPSPGTNPNPTSKGILCPDWVQQIGLPPQPASRRRFRLQHGKQMTTLKDLEMFAGWIERFLKSLERIAAAIEQQNVLLERQRERRYEQPNPR